MKKTLVMFALYGAAGLAVWYVLKKFAVKNTSNVDAILSAEKPNTSDPYAPLQ